MPLTVAAGNEPLAGYKFVKKLGQGGFGEVWEAEAPGGVRVAIKIIRLDSPQSKPELRALEIIRNIRHAHLLDVQFSVQVDDALLIAMPLCDQSLWDRLQECLEEGMRGIPIGELIRYMEELGKAVDFLNEPRHKTCEGDLIGIQHRDIKPHNIFLVGGCVRLADFGLAKFFGDGLASHTGSMSPSYVAPEALQGSVALQSDQYSMAVTYHQLRCGTLPIKGGSIGEIIYNHLNRDADLSALSEAEQPILGRALSKDPSDRWASCQEFARNLRHAVESGSDVESRSFRTSYLGGIVRGPSPFSTEPTSRAPAEKTQRPRQLTPDSMQPTSSLGYPASASEDEAEELRESAFATQVAYPTLPSNALIGTADVSVESPERRGSGLRRTVACVLGLALMALSAWGVHAYLNRPGPAPGPLGGQDAPKSTDQDQTIGTPPVVAVEPQVKRWTVQVEPRTATVLVDGKSRAIDENGRLAFEATPEASIVIAARAEGYDDLIRTLTPKDLNQPSLSISLEPIKLSNDQVARKAHTLLKDRCSRCHGLDLVVPGLDVLDHRALVRDRGSDRTPYVVPGDASRSALWVKLGGNRPHPDNDGTPPAETDVLRRWIDLGAPFPVPERRPFRSERDGLVAIRDHLRKTGVSDRKYQRYFTFGSLFRNRKLAANDLEISHAALAKAVNSLSWEPAIAVPERVDADGLVFCVDVRRLGWNRRTTWNEILTQYPYGLTHSGDQDPLHDLGEEIEMLSETRLPMVRGDWFVANASRPPLYHRLLGLPEHERELESKLGMDLRSDFSRNQFIRAGFPRSAVSAQDQVAERHSTSALYLWKTYDFGPGHTGADLARRPLGPAFDGNPFQSLAFTPSGSEILFRLPNGLQAYMLVNQDGVRMDSAPAEVAFDPLRTSGSSSLVNGLSCLACHRKGVFPLRDEVRESSAANGEALAKVKAIYPERETMNATLAEDERQFLEALRKVMAPFVKSDDVTEIPEPIGTTARRYGSELDLEAVASELGIEELETLKAKVPTLSRARRLALEPLLAGKSISRAAWRDVFPFSALELDLGTPFMSIE